MFYLSERDPRLTPNASKVPFLPDTDGGPGGETNDDIGLTPDNLISYSRRSILSLLCILIDLSR